MSRFDQIRSLVDNEKVEEEIVPEPEAPSQKSLTAQFENQIWEPIAVTTESPNLTTESTVTLVTASGYSSNAFSIVTANSPALVIESDGTINQYNNQVRNFRLECVDATPAAGNAGRMVFHTRLNRIMVDNGTEFLTIAVAHV